MGSEISSGVGAAVSDTYTEVLHVEGHHHRLSRCFGKSGDQSGNNWATEDSLTAFRAISGNAAYGSDASDEAKVFGSDDTPFISGHIYFDMFAILVTGVSNDDPFILRFVWHTSDMSSGIAAGQYSTVMVKFDTTNPQLSAGIPIAIGIPKIAVATKVWCQAKNGTNNATIDFFIDGAHGY